MHTCSWNRADGLVVCGTAHALAEAIVCKFASMCVFVCVCARGIAFTIREAAEAFSIGPPRPQWDATGLDARRCKTAPISVTSVALDISFAFDAKQMAEWNRISFAANDELRFPPLPHYPWIAIKNPRSPLIDSRKCATRNPPTLIDPSDLDRSVD